MKVGIQNSLIVQLGDVQNCYRFASEIGIGAVDLGLSEHWSISQINKNEMYGFFDKTIEEIYEYYRPYKEAAESNGITIHQMHAPFPSMKVGNHEMNAYIHMAFEKCTSLNSVTVYALTPPTLGTNVFNNNATGRKIYVPAASLNLYKAATNWSIYTDDIVAIS